MRHILAEANFEGFEMRIARMDGKTFIDIETTKDIHTRNARKLFEVEEVTPELRIATAIQDGKTLVVTKITEDIHTRNARKLFGVEEVTPELRKKAKEAMFCWHYGGNPMKVIK
jgi:DNA polymerase I-like protein with 3'-5' exonuclease and polymerase domains